MLKPPFPWQFIPLVLSSVFELRALYALINSVCMANSFCMLFPDWSKMFGETHPNGVCCKSIKACLVVWEKQWKTTVQKMIQFFLSILQLLRYLTWHVCQLFKLRKLSFISKFSCFFPLFCFFKFLFYVRKLVCVAKQHY